MNLERNGKMWLYRFKICENTNSRHRMKGVGSRMILFGACSYFMSTYLISSLSLYFKFSPAIPQMKL